MSRWPASASSRAEALPECEPPRTTFGAPITVAMPTARDAAAASSVVGNSAIVTPSGWARATSSGVVSSWLASAMPRALAISTMRGRFSSARACRLSGAAGQLLDLGRGTSRFAAVIGEIFFEIAELALSRRVVHQRDQMRRNASPRTRPGSRPRLAPGLRSADASDARRAAGPPRPPGERHRRAGATLSPSWAPASNSSMPTRKESNTVVIPAAAICAS